MYQEQYKKIFKVLDEALPNGEDFVHDLTTKIMESLHGKDDSPPKHMFITAGYGANTHEPFVQIEDVNLDQPLQLPAADARRAAQFMIEAADSAIFDAVMARFLQHELKIDEPHTMGMLSLFRGFRKEFIDDFTKDGQDEPGE